jgi:hypothetical protein
VINKQAIANNFTQKTNLPTNIRPNPFKNNSTWKTTNKSINTKKNTSQSATIRSSTKDRSALSTWHQDTNMETTSTMRQNKLHINSTILLPNLFNITPNKTSIPGSCDVSRRSDKGNDDERDEPNQFSEPNVPTYNKFQVLDKLSKEPSNQTV